MRARTPSGHDPVEEIYRRIDRLESRFGAHEVKCAEDKTAASAQRTADDVQFRSLRERGEGNEASVNKLKEALTTGLLAEATGKTRVAELETELAKEKAKRASDRTYAIIAALVLSAFFGVVGLLAGALGLVHK